MPFRRRHARSRSRKPHRFSRKVFRKYRKARIPVKRRRLSIKKVVTPSKADHQLVRAVYPIRTYYTMGSASEISTLNRQNYIQLTDIRGYTDLAAIAGKCAVQSQATGSLNPASFISSDPIRFRVVGVESKLIYRNMCNNDVYYQIWRFKPKVDNISSALTTVASFTGLYTGLSSATFVRPGMELGELPSVKPLYSVKRVRKGILRPAVQRTYYIRDHLHVMVDMAQFNEQSGAAIHFRKNLKNVQYLFVFYGGLGMNTAAQHTDEVVIADAQVGFVSETTYRYQSGWNTYPTIDLDSVMPATNTPMVPTLNAPVAATAVVFT